MSWRVRRRGAAEAGEGERKLLGWWQASKHFGESLAVHPLTCMENSSQHSGQFSSSAMAPRPGLPRGGLPAFAPSCLFECALPPCRQTNVYAGGDAKGMTAHLFVGFYRTRGARVLDLKSPIFCYGESCSPSFPGARSERKKAHELREAPLIKGSKGWKKADQRRTNEQQFASPVLILTLHSERVSWRTDPWTSSPR